jgi:nucleoside-diphosphate-sugar epimerase
MVVPALLAAGHKVQVLDNLVQGGRGLLNPWSHPDFRFIYGDLRDDVAIRRAVKDAEAVIHLAAVVGDPACARQPELAEIVNVNGSLALFRESHRAGVSRFVFASTCSNYGKMQDPGRYVDETSELRPLSLYARTKVDVEEAILSSDAARDLCVTSLRFATVFGVSPRMRFDLTVNEFTREMLTKKHLVVFGKQFWRPYVHVRDLARAIVIVLAAPANVIRNRVFNVGATEQNFQKEQLVNLIREHVPDAVVEYVHKDEDPRDYRVAFARIKSELGFEITRTVEDGIREVAQLIRDRVLADVPESMYAGI